MPRPRASADMQKIPIQDPVVERGSILIYRVYDVGQEINLTRVEAILRQDRGNFRVSIARRGRNALVMRNPPVRLNLGKTNLRLFAETVTAETFATVWEYGVISIVFQLTIASGTPWSQLISRGAALNGDIPGAEDLDTIAREKSREVSQLLHSAIERPSEWNVYEDYLIYFFEEIRGVKQALPLAGHALVPELILGESTEKLADKTRNGIRENTFQYAENDLVVIDWNSAVVVEPTGMREIPDVIEFALTHLLELRYYDDLLDQRLASLYDSIERERKGIWRTNYANLTREANARYMEFSEFLERLDNSLKVVGDFYLAVIYRASIRRLRIPDWQGSVNRKIRLLAQVSELLQGEINVTRGHTLELVVILLISFEIFSTIFRGFFFGHS